MSDDPHGSLKMPRGLKKFAERAEECRPRWSRIGERKSRRACGERSGKFLATAKARCSATSGPNGWRPCGGKRPGTTSWIAQFRPWVR